MPDSGGHRPRSGRHTGWNLSIAAGDMCSLQFAGDFGRYKCQHLGMKPGKYILIELPTITDLEEKVERGTRVTLRYVHSDTVYGFITTVVAAITEPYPILFIDYPEHVESLNLRAYERVDTYLKAQARLGDAELPGAILDLSIGGCRFTIERGDDINWPDIEPGRRLNLDFHLTGETESFDIPGRIISARMDMNSIHLGIEFDKNHQDVLAKVRDYVDGIISYLGGE